MISRIDKLTLLCCFLVSTAFGHAEPLDFDPKVFLRDHCVRCHGEKKQKGDRRFDTLNSEFSTEENIGQWQEVLDAINGGEMPPEDAGQPPAEETKLFVGGLTSRLKSAYEALIPDERATVRRLNRHEYRNTIRDLCGVNVESFDPTVDFPADERWEGFDNIGDELVLSDFLLKRYLDAASRTIDKAAQKKPFAKPVKRVFLANDLCDRKFHFRPQISFQVNIDGSFVDVGHGDRMSDRVVPDDSEAVPVDGWYTIRIKAEGVNREHPYDPRLLGIDRDEPIKMEVLVANPKMGGRLSGNATDRSIAVVPLEDHQAKVYEFRVWMDEGYLPVLRYINGPQPIKSVLFKIAPKYHRDFLPTNWRSGTDRRPAQKMEKYMSDVYEGPRMRIHRIELEGPEKAPDGKTARATLLGDQEEIDADESLKRFLFRAFRRPPLDTEVARYRDYMRSRRKLGDSKEEALLTTFKAVLCSPNFLYVEVPESETSDFKLASRLSYFLWSSMPDEELLNAARKGELSESKQLLGQAARMLEDPRSGEFVRRFTDSWLHLNELGSMPPDEVKFRVFYKRQLQPLMKKETQHFFAEILSENLSIENFIDSDFTFLNRYLGDHYGMPGIVGDHFRRVTLPKDSYRGGLLGQASILTATANGVETSPVTRGIWVLENILGTPPSPPPPDVEPLEPDIRGATTIREQLAKHRKVETCAECHRKIDPAGFAMESFDPIGSLRSKYLTPKGKPGNPVDSKGKLATGEEFENIRELKILLLQRKDQFAHCLTEKMLTYSLGRKLGLKDRPQVDAIVKGLAERGYGLRDLLELVIASDAFSDRGTNGGTEK